jgi:uncharacterized membrane protein (GlpM family)
MSYAIDLGIRFVIAGTMVVIISIVAEKFKNPFLAGLLVIFPSLTLTTVYFIGRAAGTEVAANLVLGELLSIPVWIVYAIALYYFLKNMELLPALLYSFLIFLLGGFMFIVLKNRFIQA